MIDYLKEFEDKGFFTCADILNESERKELLSNLYVCKHCDYHFRIGANERFKIFLFRCKKPIH